MQSFITADTTILTISRLGFGEGLFSLARHCISSSGNLAQGISNLSIQLTEEDGLHIGDNEDTDEGDDGEEDTICGKKRLDSGDAHTEAGVEVGVANSVIKQTRTLPTFNHKQ